MQVTENLLKGEMYQNLLLKEEEGEHRTVWILLLKGPTEGRETTENRGKEQEGSKIYDVGGDCAWCNVV